MRRQYAMVAAIATALALVNFDKQRAHAEQSFPYTAYTTRDDAGVRSGPGQDFYVTDHLDWGSKVEVYRHDQSEWCAIRPPAHSFSWVAAKHVRLTDDKSLGRITVDNARTRVGSRLDDSHDVEYIKLRRDEVVEVLGLRALQEPHGGESTKWFKVAPPAGEFRWIHRQHLSRQPPGNSSPTKLVASDSSDRSKNSVAVASPAPMQSRLANSTQPIPADAEADSAVTRTGFEEVSQLNSEVDQAKREPEISFTSGDKPVSDSLWRDAAPTTETIAANTETFDDRLTEVNVLLSQTVIQEVELWELQPLRDRVNQLLQSAETDEQLVNARSLLKKLADFEQLQNRHQALLQPASINGDVKIEVPEPPKPLEFSADEPTLPLLGDVPVIAVTESEPRLVATERSQSSRTDVSTPSISTRTSITKAGPGFDATGWLVPVRSKRKGVPTHALTDSKGTVLQFVSLEPGLNVEPYLHQEVGITGRRGYLTQLRKPHLTAAQVVPLRR